MSPADTNYAQETVESPLYWITGNLDISALLTYQVFGDQYNGNNDYSILYCLPDTSNEGNDNTAHAFCGSFPGPGTFDN